MSTSQGCRRLVIALWGGVVGPQTAVAEAEQDPVSAAAVSAPQELFLGEPPQVQERLELQLTSGLRWHADGEASDTSAPLAVELGLTERLQVEAESQVESPAGAAEMTGFEAGLLYALDGRAPVLVSAGLSAGLAGLAGEEELAWTVEPALLLQQPLGRFGINLRFGAELERAFEGDDGEVGAAAALSCFAAVSGLYPAVEAAVEVSDQETSVVVAAGLAWAPVDGVEIGVAMPVQLDGGATRAGVIGTLTWEMELAENEP